MQGVCSQWDRVVAAQGPLNNFDNLTVRIVSFVEVTSMSSLSGQAACISTRFCILFLSSRWFPLATSALYLFIAFRADFMSIEISTFGGFPRVGAQVTNPVLGWEVEFLSLSVFF